MAKFDAELPTELMKTFQELGANTEKMCGDMVKAGAQQVEKTMRANVPAAFVGSDIMNCLKVTQVYKTPSDDGTNCKVAFYGYFQNEDGIETPAPLVVNVFEYGRHGEPFKKHPFVRKSFNKRQIEAAMQKAQEKYIPKE